MEALSSLTFKGSVMEAIFEAKGQKKLFVVYISGKVSSSEVLNAKIEFDLDFFLGDDEESDKLNNLTWTDASVGFLFSFSVTYAIKGSLFRS